jgi:Tol biopolymer transport system component
LVTKNAMNHGVGISPDGKKIAFICHPDTINSSLNVALSDGSGEYVITKGRVADYFGFDNPPSWSPDGKLVTATSSWLKEHYLSALRAFPVNGGAPSLLLASPGLAGIGPWLPDQSGFLLIYSLKLTNPQQIWFRSYPRGSLQRITNDVKNYRDLNLNREGKLLSAVASETIATAYIGPSTNLDRYEALTTGNKDGFALAWMPDGMLLLRNFDGEYSLMQADGSNRVPLFRDEGWKNNVSVCGDGRFIVFPSRREGNHFNIWRADSSNGALKRLIQGEQDMVPHCSADGKWVIYDGSTKTSQTIQKVSVDGGTSSVLEEGELYGARWSPDDKQIAAYDCANNQCKIRVFGAHGGPALKSFALPSSGTRNY